MRQGEAVKKRVDRGRPRQGDIIVTDVGGHYAISRLKVDRETQEYIGSQQDRAEGLTKACGLAGATHRVFLFQSTGAAYLPFDCSEVLPEPTICEKKQA
jgi:hypothetical protein